MAGSKNSWQEGAQNYRAFLLRCWQEEELENGGEAGESSLWRFALVPINDRSNKVGFVCLEELFVYLRGELIQGGGSAAAGSQLSRLDISTRKDEYAS